jgi:hypothetical protein
MPLGGSLLQLQNHDSSEPHKQYPIPVIPLGLTLPNIAQPTPETHYNITLIDKVLDDINRLVFTLHSDSLKRLGMFRL